MAGSEKCDFCERDHLGWRTIQSDDFITSFVSVPRFRPGHCLVIPNRHIITPSEFNPQESVAIMGEIGRLMFLLDQGFGAGFMQKYQPTQQENHIRREHFHVHVFPRIKNEEGLFPVPDPNSFEGFEYPTEEEVLDYVELLK